MCGVVCCVGCVVEPSRVCEDRGGFLLACFFVVVCVALYKVSDNVYMQKAEKNIVFANFCFWQRSCQLLFLTEF